MVQPDEMTPGQVAKLLHVSPATVVRWSQKGLLPTSRVLPSGHRRFARGDVETLRRRIEGQDGQPDA